MNGDQNKSRKPGDTGILAPGEQPLDLNQILAPGEQPLDLNQITAGGSDRGYIGGALAGLGESLSPVPTSAYGQAWDALSHPLSTGWDLLKRGAAAVGGEVASPIVSAYRVAQAVDRGDWAEAAKQYAYAIPGVSAATNLARSTLASSQAEIARAKAAQERGDKYLAGTELVAAGVPVVGPQIGAGLERFRQGQLAGNKGEMGAGAAEVAAVPLSFVLPELAEGALGRLRSVARPYAGRFADAMEEVPEGLAPAESLSKAAVLDAAKNMGVTLPLGKATGSKPLKMAEAITENSLFGAAKMEQVAKANQAAIDNRWGQLVNAADPNNIGPTPLLTGENLAGQGQDLLSLSKQRVEAGYNQMEPFYSRIGRVFTKALGDFGIGKRYDLNTGEQNILAPDILKAVEEAMDVRKVEGRKAPQSVGATFLPEAAGGSGGVRPDMSAEMPSGAAIPGHDGDAMTLKTVGGDLAGSYRVVENKHLKTSHNPWTFQWNSDYPRPAQPRDYSTDTDGQGRVVGNAQKHDPSFVINNNPDGINGPPVILPDGTVMGGNGRAMSLARLYAEGRGALYKQRLMEQAAQFGLDPAEIEKFEQPVLVRQLAETPGTLDEAGRLGVNLNESFTGALTDSQQAVSAGRSLTPGTLRAVGAIFDELPEGSTLNDLLEARPAPVFSLMRRDGLIPDSKEPNYWDRPGRKFTPDGKNFVRKALLGSVVNDVGTLDRAPDSLLNRVGRTLPEMSRVMGRGLNWDISPAVQQALNEHAILNAQGLTLEDYVRQPIMFGERNPVVDAIVQRLGESGPGYKKALTQFASDAATDVPGQAMLPGAGKAEAWRSFNDAFGTALTEKQYNQAVRDAKKGVSSGIQSTGAEQASSAVQSGRTEQIYGAGRRAEGAGRSAESVGGSGAVGEVSAGSGEQDRTVARRGQDGAVGAGNGPAGTGEAGGGAGAGGGGGIRNIPASAITVLGPDSINFQSSRNIKKVWFDRANDYSPPIRDEYRGINAKKVELLDAAQEEAVRQAGPEAYETWRSANAGYKKHVEDWDGPGSVLKPLVNTPDTQLAGLQQKYLQQGKAGGEPNQIRGLLAQGVDVSGLRHQALNDIAAKGFSVGKGPGGHLGGYSDEFLRALFPPEFD